MRVRLSTTAVPLVSGVLAMAKPVLPPWGTMGVPCAAHWRTTAATSWVWRGRTTAKARPGWRPRQSRS